MTEPIGNSDPAVVPSTKPLDPPKKVKDPRRVEAGEKLAKISQQAKAAKKARLEENLKTEVRESCMTEGIGLGSLYLTWKSRDDKKPVKQDEIIYENNNDVEKDPPKEPFDDLFD
ncbi:Hypothetical predicted protein [Paramuricea clavata]|uniref:Uncharacterized protein n=1 Tax=Paramuricea clavata TaxID=317549 RepID=A0A6S7FIU8_PARCT|nr:Hypothetical predicted protein [Paramuricea clavata]